MVFIVTRSNASELYHHGIKGQKWGVRRFQTEDGSLTPAGEKRYGDGGHITKNGKHKSGGDKMFFKAKKTDIKSGSEQPKKNFIQKRKDKLMDHYISKGYEPEAASIMVKQRMKTEAILAVVGGVALTAAAVKVSRRIGQDYLDKTFKSGHVIQNIGANKNATFQDTPFFAAVNNSDKKTYGMNYASEKRSMAKGFAQEKGLDYDGIYNNQIKLTGTIKRASVRNAQKIFYEKMDKDPKFREEVLGTLKKTDYWDNNAVTAYKNGRHSRKFYDRFNQALATPQFQEAGLHKKYYDEMKKHGYNAILDINDTRYSGYRTISKSPTIFFGNDKWDKISSRKLSDVEIDNNAAKFTQEYLIKSTAKGLAARVGIIAGVKSISDQRKIEKYLDEHPNSKLSRKEILKAIHAGE